MGNARLVPVGDTLGDLALPGFLCEMRDVMKNFANRLPDWVLRWLPSICLLLVFLMTAAVAVLAHDPGLSAAELKLVGDQLHVRMTYARQDIEPLVKLDTDGDGQVSAGELATAQSALQALMQETVVLTSDGRPLPSDKVQVTTDDSNAVHCELEFSAVAGAQMQLRSLLPARLALGHKQFLTLRAATGETLGARLLDASNDLYELELATLAGHTKPQTFWGFLLLGIEHILTGFDHLAFLLALLLAGSRLREALKIITSFTIAHSITLALATLNWVNLPANIVEPLIAVSIIYVGIENLFRREIKGRWLLTFAFGLIHGFGFAGVLRELGIGADGNVVMPLLTFNLGVELGQIGIAALVLPLIWKLRQQPAFVPRYVPACSLLVALAGGYWLLQRTLF